MGSFDHFVRQIPQDIYRDVEVYMGKQVALFKPKNYIGNVLFLSEDYNVILPTGCPPPTRFGSREYEVGKGRLVVINPQTPVFCKQDFATDRRYFSLSIQKQLLSEVAEDMGLCGDVTFAKVENPCSPYIRQAIGNFQYEIANYGHSSSLVIDSISIQIAAALLRELESNVNTGRFPLVTGDAYVKNAVDYIRTFSTSNITLADICREIHITPYHFIRLFKERTGMTPHEYLLRVRIENAKILLKSNHYTVAEVGGMCGFVNTAHFSAVFKRFVGIPPLAFKKQ